MEGGGCRFWLNLPFFSPSVVSSFQLTIRAHMCLGKEWKFLNRMFFGPHIIFGGAISRELTESSIPSPEP